MAEVVDDPPRAPGYPLDVLFLDDDAEARQLVEFGLGGLGHRVLCAGSVREAINLLHTFVFDVIICDLSLPDGSGLDVVHHVPAGPPVRKIILSGYGETTDVARTLAAGFDAHLVKPLDFALLQQTMQKLIAQT